MSWLQKKTKVRAVFPFQWIFTVCVCPHWKRGTSNNVSFVKIVGGTVGHMCGRGN